MKSLKHVLLAAGLLAVTLPAWAQAEPGGATEGLRDEIRERKAEIREDERELRDKERKQERRRRERHGAHPLRLHVGLNGSHVDEGQENCGGFQGGVSYGKVLMVRLEYSQMSYENEDDTESCDVILSGDSTVNERSLLGGFVLGRSGLFVAAGPSAVDFERPGEESLSGAWGQDTGTRYEVGWNSRLSAGTPVGFELVAFKSESDVRDLHGVAMNFVFGPRR